MGRRKVNKDSVAGRDEGPEEEPKELTSALLSQVSVRPNSIPLFPKIGTVAFVSVFTTPEVNYLDIKLVFTGTPAAMPTARKIEKLFREQRP